MMFKIPSGYDSKFRFCVVAAMRAAQIQGGALSALQTVSTKPTYIAMREAEANLIKWKILEDEEPVLE